MVVSSGAIARSGYIQYLYWTWCSCCMGRAARMTGSLPTGPVFVKILQDFWIKQGVARSKPGLICRFQTINRYRLVLWADLGLEGIIYIGNEKKACFAQPGSGRRNRKYISIPGKSTVQQHTATQRQVDHLHAVLAQARASKSLCCISVDASRRTPPKKPPNRVCRRIGVLWPYKALNAKYCLL